MRQGYPKVLAIPADGFVEVIIIIEEVAVVVLLAMVIPHQIYENNRDYEFKIWLTFLRRAMAEPAYTAGTPRTATC